MEYKTFKEIRKTLVMELNECFTDDNFKFIKIMNKEIEEGTDREGFFPYCSGWIGNSAPIVGETILFLGQDFGTEKYFLKINNTGEVRESTCNGLKKLGESILNKGFLSNIFVGLRKHPPMKGLNHEALSLKYIDLNKKYLDIQIEVINPSLIILLGHVPHQFVRNNYDSIFDDEKTNEIMNFKFKKEDSYLSFKAKFDKSYQCLTIAHPSNWISKNLNSENYPKIITELLNKG